MSNRAPDPYPRIVHLRGRRPVITGQDHSRWTDFYQAMLSAPWWAFLAGMAAVYFALNALFAILYMFDASGITHAHPGSFADAFFFSMQTLGTYATDGMEPRSAYVDSVVTIESFFSILTIAVATGAVFARVSRPTSRVLFSRSALITPFDGMPTLMFRAANQRGNQIMEAEVTVTLAHQVMTREGFAMRRFDELKLMRARTPLFALSWTVMHVIDDTSPLVGATRESMLADQIEIIVVLSGTDETFSDKIFARHSYMPHEIHWNKRFVDILSVRPDGRRLVDLSKFHALTDTDDQKSA